MELLTRLRRNKLGGYLVVFILMCLPPAPLYFAAQSGATGWLWFLIGLVVLGNLLALAIG